MREELALRGYSPRTRKTYLNQARGFLRATDEHPSRLGPAHVRRYLHGLLDERRVSHSYADQHVSALKFLFAHVLGRPLEDVDTPRPKRQRKLPTVLSRGEVLAILATVRNRKHRAILLLVYSSGLRVGEVVRLEHADLDVHRGLLHIRQSKGRKDRYVPLSVVGLDAVQRYLRYQPVQNRWLFPGQRPERHLSERTVQHVFARARDRAGIGKPATVHTLRHSYATHLHENGIGIRYIQALLGHQSSRTTEIYTHVSKTSLANVTSPLDQIMTPGEGRERFS
jgi:site-specific recombinase XerD